MPRRVNYLEDAVDDFVKKKKKGNSASSTRDADYTALLKQMGNTVRMRESMQKMYGKQIKKKAPKPRKLWIQ